MSTSRESKTDVPEKDVPVDIRPPHLHLGIFENTLILGYF